MSHFYSIIFIKLLIAYKSSKGLIGGIVAGVVIYGDTVSDTECETGYVKVENVCAETCGLTPCEEMINI